MNQSILEIIKLRKSVRAYSSKPVGDDILNDIQNYIDSLKNPFNRQVHIKVLKPGNYEGVKLGTYGVIKNPRYFLVAYCEKKPFSYEALGYMFEKVVLYCTSLGLGTVWLGGTFNRSKFAIAADMPNDYVMPAVSPFGYESSKKGAIGLLMGDNSNKRKPFSSLFYRDSFLNPLTVENAGIYKDALKAVRKAPSSLNSQPWRVVICDDAVHFFTAKSMDMNKLDIGIALCHFDVVMEEKGISGKFKILNPNINSKNEYVISWVPAK